MKTMKQSIKPSILIWIFLTTLIIGVVAQAVCDLPAVRSYIKKEIRAAVMLNLITKYNIKPQGTEA